ncbi:multidrug efflux SMR transporter (plasmid) [Klebsiella pneumoniae]|nr:multidrug efflux SMR transporter [Klebsiella pneumoniae]HDH0894723.1 multidrug efflux SMR transporter [Klebsiella pneumoniae]
MNPVLIAYSSLAVAIVSEVVASSFLQRSAQFTKLWPTFAMVAFYILSFYMLSQALRVIPLGIAYAIWGGLGIVLTAIVSVYVFKHSLDAWAIVGICMIVGGVIVMNVLSKSAGH